MEIIDLRDSKNSPCVEICLLRHGKTDHNQADEITRFAGMRVNTSLSKEGVLQTEKLAGELIKFGKFDLILTSGMSRAIQTGSIIAQKYDNAGIQVKQQIINNFEEIDTGDFTGLTEKEAKELNPEAAFAFYNADFDQLNFPNGESTDDLKKRFRSVQNQLLKIKAKKIILIGHGMFNRFIVWLANQNQTKIWQQRKYPHDRVIILNWK